MPTTADIQAAAEAAIGAKGLNVNDVRALLGISGDTDLGTYIKDTLNQDLLVEIGKLIPATPDVLSADDIQTAAEAAIEAKGLSADTVRNLLGIDDTTNLADYIQGTLNKELLDKVSTLVLGGEDIQAAVTTAIGDLGLETGATDQSVAALLGLEPQLDDAGNVVGYADLSAKLNASMDALNTSIVNDIGLILSDIPIPTNADLTAAAEQAIVNQGIAGSDILSMLGVPVERDPDTGAVVGYTDLSSFVSNSLSELRDGLTSEVAGLLQLEPQYDEVGTFIGYADLAGNIQAAAEAAISDLGVDQPGIASLLGLEAQLDADGNVVGYSNLADFISGSFQTNLLNQIGTLIEGGPTGLSAEEIRAVVDASISNLVGVEPELDENGQPTGRYLDLLTSVRAILGIDESTDLASYLDASVTKLENGILTDIYDRVGSIETLTAEDITTAAEAALTSAGVDDTGIRNILGLGLDDEGNPISLTDYITEQFDTVYSDISEGITGVGNQLTALTDLIEQYRAAGATADAATNTAIADLAATLGTTEETLLAELGTTRDALAGQISDVGGQVTDLSDQVQLIADYIGKPADQVTQTDIDFVVDVIAGNAVANEQQVLDYDTNADGVVDQTDLDTLTSMQTGLAFDIPDQSRFAGTGIYGLFNELALQQQQIAAAQLTQQNRLAQQQLLTTLLTQPTGGGAVGISGAAAQAPSPVDLNYVYDWSSIFATPQQERLFPSPYSGTGGGLRDLAYGIPRPQPQAQTTNPFARGLFGASGGYVSGGQINSDTDRLLRILGDT